MNEDKAAITQAELQKNWEEKVKLIRDLEKRDRKLQEQKAFSSNLAPSSGVAGCIGFGAMPPPNNINECAQSDAPWKMSNHEAKAQGFRNGVTLTQQSEILKTLKSCLERMEKFKDLTLTSREDALAITHLEDCIMRMERAVRNTEKILGINGY